MPAIAALFAAAVLSRASVKSSLDGPADGATLTVTPSVLSTDGLAVEVSWDGTGIVSKDGDFIAVSCGPTPLGPGDFLVGLFASCSVFVRPDVSGLIQQITWLGNFDQNIKSHSIPPS